MSGTDKILMKLSADCDAECKAIYESAREKVEAIKREAELNARAKAAEITAEADKRAEDIMRLAQSSKKMKARRSELSRKVKLLDSVLAEALSELNSLDNESYFSVIKNLAVKNALTGNGTLVMSEADADNAPQDFIEKINSELPENSGLTVKADKNFNKKGIILIYGNIEINLTFEALIDACADILKETASGILFA